MAPSWGKLWRFVIHSRSLLYNLKTQYILTLARSVLPRRKKTLVSWYNHRIEISKLSIRAWSFRRIIDHQCCDLTRGLVTVSPRDNGVPRVRHYDTAPLNYDGWPGLTITKDKLNKSSLKHPAAAQGREERVSVFRGSPFCLVIKYCENHLSSGWMVFFSHKVDICNNKDVIDGGGWTV